MAEQTPPPSPRKKRRVTTTPPPYPAVQEIARAVLLLTKSRREVLQDMMTDTTVHRVQVQYAHGQGHFCYTEPVLWNPLELRWDDVSTRQCERKSNFVNVLRARGYVETEDGDFERHVPTAVMQAYYLK